MKTLVALKGFDLLLSTTTCIFLLGGSIPKLLQSTLRMGDDARVRIKCVEGLVFVGEDSYWHVVVVRVW